METKDKIQIASLILIAVLIVVLTMAIVVLAKKAEEIRSNPVQYAIDNDFYNSCYCFGIQGKAVNFNKEMVIQNWSG